MDGDTLVILLAGGKTPAAERHRQGPGVLVGLQTEKVTMPMTTSFKARVLDRAGKEPEFAVAILKEGIQALFDGEINVGKALLRDCINSTIGFNELAEATGIPAKSLQRMFSKTGNPQTDNLFKVISALVQHNGINLEVAASKHRAA